MKNLLAKQILKDLNEPLEHYFAQKDYFSMLKLIAEKHMSLLKEVKNGNDGN